MLIHSYRHTRTHFLKVPRAPQFFRICGRNEINEEGSMTKANVLPATPAGETTPATPPLHIGG